MDFFKILLMGIIFLFIGLIINFYFKIQIPEFYLVPMEESDSFLGLEAEPIFVRFVNYLIRFFTGDWLNSSTIFHRTTVFELLKSSVPRMIEIIILPLIIGFILGKILKNRLNRKDHKYLRIIFTVLGGIGISIPVFWFGLYLQFYFFGALTIDLISNISLPHITGFLTLDSIIAGYWEQSWQIFMLMILPILSLTMLITILTARDVTPKQFNNSHNDSIISNSLQTSMIFSLVLTFYMITDITFYLHGFGYTLFNALNIFDAFLIEGCMFVIIILFVTCIFISNLYFIIKSPSGLNTNNDNQEEALEGNSLHNLKEDVVHLKRYLINRIKSPFFIVGASIVVFLIIISIFPQLLTPYKLSEITAPFRGDEVFAPPTPEHPLGTTYYGYDLLAVVIWGLRDLLVSIGWVMLISLIGGLSFGILAVKFERSDRQIILFVMTLFYIFPSIIIISIMLWISEANQSVGVFIIGTLLIPIFTYKIANSKPRFANIFKKLIRNIPLVLIIAILLYTSISFFGFADRRTSQLGYSIYRGYSWISPENVMARFWVVFWPGLAIFTVNLGLFLMYLGLNSSDHELQE